MSHLSACHIAFSMLWKFPSVKKVFISCYYLLLCNIDSQQSYVIPLCIITLVTYGDTFCFSGSSIWLLSLS